MSSQKAMRLAPMGFTLKMVLETNQGETFTSSVWLLDLVSIIFKKNKVSNQSSELLSCPDLSRFFIPIYEGWAHLNHWQT